MTREDTGLTPEQFQYYYLGREARKSGFGREACNVAGMNERKGAWLSGWHDQDIETGSIKTRKAA